MGRTCFFFWHIAFDGKFWHVLRTCPKIMSHDIFWLPPLASYFHYWHKATWMNILLTKVTHHLRASSPERNTSSSSSLLNISLPSSFYCRNHFQHCILKVLMFLHELYLHNVGSCLFVSALVVPPGAKLVQLVSDWYWLNTFMPSRSIFIVFFN